MSVRCALCPGSNKCLPPSGPCDVGGILFCGEAPGISEEKHGLVFCGKTGEEVNDHYLPLAGLKRRDVTFVNSISCLPITSGGKLDPKRAADLALLQCCAETNLYPLIERMSPKLLVPMGNFAIRGLGMDVDLDLQHGIPCASPWGMPAFCMFHPALGLHEPKKMLHVRTDWDRLRKYLRGTLLLPHDEYPDPDYAEVESIGELDEIDPTLVMAADTESGREGPAFLTYSQQPGKARLIRAERRDLLNVFQAKLDAWESQILFHNWLYDWNIVEDMELRFPVKRVVDTMARVYHLGNLPQGLKALAFRELGMQMQDFDDLVTPFSTQRVLEYYRLAYAETWEKPEPRLVRDEDGKWKVYKPQSMNTKLKRFFTDYVKSQGTKDVFNMWEKNWEDEQGMIEAKMGLWPGKDIRHVPEHLSFFYAMRDSDSLIRLWPVIVAMSRLVRRYSQELWVEKAGERRVA